MPIFARAVTPPRDVLARLDLPAGDAVLAAVRAGDTWLLGSRTGFFAIAEQVLAVPWERIEQAAWDTETGTLKVCEVGEWGLDRPVHRFVLEHAERLLDLVRERVTKSLLLQRRITVSGKRGFSVVARRAPAGGEVGWFVEYDEGIEPDDVVVSDLVQGALAAARSDLGELV